MVDTERERLSQLSRLALSRLHLPRWSLTAVLALGMLVVACGDNQAPVFATPKPLPTESVPNQPNTQGDYATSVKPGACAPYTRPNWDVEHNLQFRCVDPSEDYRKELRIRVTNLRGDILVGFNNEIQIEGVLTVTYGQSLNMTNPLNSNCTLQIINRGHQPMVNQTCLRN